jgi:RimJ/RimL family protein N-acetyltransferase
MDNEGMIEHGFPDEVETERLVLRRYRSEDAAEILELVQRNQAQLAREFAQTAGLRSVDDAQAFTGEKQEQWNVGRTFCYGIWRKQPREQIGQIQVKNIGWEIPSAELGYFIDRSAQRRGYASESIGRILGLAFQQLGFQRIFVRILPSNRESFSLAKKLGFQEEGLHRRAFRCGFGELHDVHYLSLTREDYQRLFTP